MTDADALPTTPSPHPEPVPETVAPLTESEARVLAARRALEAGGGKPTYAALAGLCGVGPKRVEALIDRLRRRGLWPRVGHSRRPDRPAPAPEGPAVVPHAWPGMPRNARRLLEAADAHQARTGRVPTDAEMSEEVWLEESVVARYRLQLTTRRLGPWWRGEFRGEYEEVA